MERIHRLCPNCGTVFRPQDQIVEIVEGATGKKHCIAAGLCYRFAIVVDCGKDFPTGSDDEEPQDPHASALFLETCSKALGIELYEVSLYT